MDHDPIEYSSRVKLLRSVMLVTAQWAECRSKDPSTKVGACVYDRDTGAMFLGYNGFPKGIHDMTRLWHDKEGHGSYPCKYELVIHAEVNAILKALQAGVTMSRCVLLVTHFPCDRCMKDVIATSGIKSVFYDHPTYPSLTARTIMVTEWIADALGIELAQLKDQV